MVIITIKEIDRSFDQLKSMVAFSSRVCNQSKIITFLSYFDNGFPLSRSISRGERELLSLLCFKKVQSDTTLDKVV